MKKALFTLISAIFFLSACTSTDVMITFAQLPADAQQFIKQYFSQESVSLVKADKGWHTEYEVILLDGSSIEFDSKGIIEQVDCKTRPVPEGIVPEQITASVRAQFPNCIIVKYSSDKHDYEVELNNDIELKYSKSFRILEID